jgi:two-component system sensor histidine kinase HupT/HoxJ
LASRAASLRRAGITVTRQDAKDPPPILGDALLLQQALLNILINAEHAVLAAGTETRGIAIATAVDESRARVSISVHDSGTGIPDDVLPRIFDPFFTTKEVGKGTGLGLAITYGIIQEHGGTITATNDPRGGAIFRIDLPPAEVVVK